MRQARWTEKSIALVDVEPPPLPESWVRLAVSACGICGTDLHLLRRELPVVPGGVPGHEIAGVPLDGPAGIADAIYAVEPRIWCGTCPSCAEGERQLCQTGELFGIQRPGGIADFVDVPLTAVHRVDASVDSRVAAISEPLAVCVRGLRRATLAPNDRVLVLGAGTIGLLSGMLARDRVEEVAITARHPHQRDAAKQLGLQVLEEGDAPAWAREHRPNVILESVGGSSDTLNNAIFLCRPGGRVVVLGVFSYAPSINATVLTLNEVSLIGSNTYGADANRSDFGDAVSLLPSFAAEIARLQTHSFGLERLEDAFACAEDKSSGAIKVTLEPKP